MTPGRALKRKRGERGNYGWNGVRDALASDGTRDVEASAQGGAYDWLLHKRGQGQGFVQGSPEHNFMRAVLMMQGAQG